MPDEVAARGVRIAHERRNLLRQISQMLDKPMTVLSFVWLGLMIVDFTRGLSPALETTNRIIWLLFILHFVLEFWVAPRKFDYLRTNWLTALALVLPAFRTLRVFRALRILRTAQVGRGVRLLRWLTSLNRGMRATQRSLARRGLPYVLVLTALVAFAGAAGVYEFENPQALAEAGLSTPTPQTGIRSYSEALWWTAMMLTTMGSDYFPKSPEGRVLSLLLAIYGFAIFGYITATVASLIIRVDQTARSPDEPLKHQLAAVQAEIRALRLALANAGPPPAGSSSMPP